MDRWLSGLRRTIGNRVMVNSYTGVQIPLCPPQSHNPILIITKKFVTLVIGL